MGYGELLRVLEEEASREAREVRAAGAREADRIRAEARGAAEAARAALRAREAGAIDARLRAAREAHAIERQRALLVEERAALAALREEAVRRLPARAGADVAERLAAEVLREAGPGPGALVVDPGEEEAARRALAAAGPEVARRIEVRTAAAPRGGVELVQGRRVLDDTLAARLARAWPALEAELAEALFGEGGAWPGSTT
jgi:V/A-type H+-transporting ATPase subunit E